MTEPSPSVFTRSPALFVRRVQCARRKAILRREYGLQENSVKSRIAGFVRICLDFLAFAQLFTLALQRARADSPLPKRQTIIEAIAFFALTASALIHSYQLLQRGLWLSLTASAARAASFAIMAISTALIVGDNSKAYRALWFAGALGMSASSIYRQIVYKSFSGLFGPIWPSQISPTVFPTFAMNTLSGVLMSVGGGMMVFTEGWRDEWSSSSRAAYIVTASGFGMGLILSWSKVGVFLISIKKERLRREKQDFIEQELLKAQRLQSQKSATVAKTPNTSEEPFV